MFKLILYNYDLLFYEQKKNLVVRMITRIEDTNI